MRKEKGITLVALIITIIVLLILAAVTIMSLNGDNIITKSREAKDKYASAQDYEESKLLEYDNIMHNIMINAGW